MTQQPVSSVDTSDLSHLGYIVYKSCPWRHDAYYVLRMRIAYQNALNYLVPWCNELLERYGWVNIGAGQDDKFAVSIRQPGTSMTIELPRTVAMFISSDTEIIDDMNVMFKGFPIDWDETGTEPHVANEASRLTDIFLLLQCALPAQIVFIGLRESTYSRGRGQGKSRITAGLSHACLYPPLWWCREFSDEVLTVIAGRIGASMAAETRKLIKDSAAELAGFTIRFALLHSWVSLRAPGMTLEKKIRNMDIQFLASSQLTPPPPGFTRSEPRKRAVEEEHNEHPAAKRARTNSTNCEPSSGSRPKSGRRNRYARSDTRNRRRNEYVPRRFEESVTIAEITPPLSASVSASPPRVDRREHLVRVGQFDN